MRTLELSNSGKIQKKEVKEKNIDTREQSTSRCLYFVNFGRICANPRQDIV